MSKAKEAGKQDRGCGKVSERDESKIRCTMVCSETNATEERIVEAIRLLIEAGRATDTDAR
jgi:hypothetical protein